MSHEGIPAGFTATSAEQWLRPRLSDKRFDHSKGVAEIAVKIARRCNCDPFLAEIGGWLHDCCKEIKAPELVEMARDFVLPLDPILEAHGHLLHGPVGAEVCRRELKIENREVYDAIAEHTLGKVGMTVLSKVLFLADCLEESRPASYTKPIWAALDVDGECDLDRAMVVAQNEGIKYLIDDGKPIHPRAVEVRNYYLRV